MAVHVAAQELTAPFVRAMLEWGWASYIHLQWQTDEIEELIKRYLAEHNWQVLQAFRSLQDGDTRPDPESARLSDERSQNQANGAALGALLEIQYLVKKQPVFV